MSDLINPNPSDITSIIPVTEIPLSRLAISSFTAMVSACIFCGLFPAGAADDAGAVEYTLFFFSFSFTLSSSSNILSTSSPFFIAETPFMPRAFAKSFSTVTDRLSYFSLIYSLLNYSLGICPNRPTNICAYYTLYFRKYKDLFS